VNGADKQVTWEKLFGQSQHPYFIYTPRWIETSSGIKVLHMLCHTLNQSGQKAYLVLSESNHSGDSRINPYLFTPILTQEVVDAYYVKKITPIIVYPETIPGNPLNADLVVRYLMNFVGLLGGSQKFASSEYLISYSKSIGKDYSGEGKQMPTLFLPSINPRDFENSEASEPYQLSYAAKYRLFVGAPPKIGDLKNIEIVRDGPNRQPRGLVRQLIQRASVVYVFENTAIIIESILSGTPVILVKTPFLNKIIADDEIGIDSTVFLGLRANEILKISNLPLSRQKYIESIDNYFVQLGSFISETQSLASTIPIKMPITVPVFSGLPITRHRIRLGFQIYRNLGIRTLSVVIYYFILRRIPSRLKISKKLVKPGLE
jgi:hypothetical protein